MVILTHDEKMLFCEERDDWLKEIDKEKGQSKLINTIRRLCLKEDDDVIMYFAGRRGCGKSTLAIEFMVRADPDWTPWEQMAYEPPQVLEIVENAKPGSGLLWDEIQEGMSALEFMSTDSKAMRGILNLIRKKNIFFTFTGPVFTDAGTGARRVCTVVARVRKKSVNNRKARIYKVWVDELYGNIGFKTIRKSLKFGPFPDGAYDVYEKFKDFNIDRFMKKSKMKMFIKRVAEFMPGRPTQVWTVAYRIGGITFSQAEGIVGKTNAARSLKSMTEMGFMKKENGKYIAVMPADLI